MIMTKDKIEMLSNSLSKREVKNNKELTEKAEYILGIKGIKYKEYINREDFFSKMKKLSKELEKFSEFLENNKQNPVTLNYAIRKIIYEGRFPYALKKGLLEDWSEEEINLEITLRKSYMQTILKKDPCGFCWNQKEIKEFKTKYLEEIVEELMNNKEIKYEDYTVKNNKSENKINENSSRQKVLFI